jgi:hypothetical protein
MKISDKSCDNCDSQEDRHYCLLNSCFMDIYYCDDWVEE